jgi:hypothetical protein
MNDEATKLEQTVEEPEQQMYRVHWRMKNSIGHSGMGEPTSWELAQAWAKHGNNKGLAVHWVQPA